MVYSVIIYSIPAWKTVSSGTFVYVHKQSYRVDCFHLNLPDTFAFSSRSANCGEVSHRIRQERLFRYVIFSFHTVPLNYSLYPGWVHEITRSPGHFVPLG
ncbi:MAG: hypothetical protein AMS27_15035 [Bacteroides sp. SM23_62_1]|nr:MAG: hypothetical protein AMS27_15035 [Bacteroides sp. SM23_62_1]